MKRLTLLAIALAIPTPVFAGTVFHVRSDGSDTACDGHADAAEGATSCAFRTGQKAADTIAPGDDIVFHAGTYAAFTLRAVFQASAADPTVIEGDPVIARSEIRIEGGSASAALYSAGGTSSSTRSRFITIQHLSLGGGTNAALYLDHEHDDITLRDLHLDDFARLGGSATGTINGGRHSPAPRDAAIIYNYGSRALIEDIRIVGGPHYCAVPQGGGSLCGVDASAISLAASSSVVRGVHADDFLGNFLIRAPAPDGLVENCRVERFGCDSDDGCVQLYNTANVVIRHNLFVETTPINEVLGVIRMRRTGTNTREPSAEIYNNTFVGNTSAGLIARVNKKAVDIAPPGAASSYGPTAIKNNIFIDNYGDSDGTGAALTVSHCPTSLAIDHNLYFNNIKDYFISAACTGTYETNAVFADPMLDTNFAPPIGSPACGAGENGVDIGALPCGYDPTTPPDGFPSDAGTGEADPPAAVGCGCQTGGDPRSALAIGFVFLARWRRRR